MNAQRGNAAIGLLIVIALIGWGVASAFSSDESEYDYEPSSSYPASTYNAYDYSSDDSNDYSDYSPSAGFEGTEEMEACNQSSGNCYDLEIDSDGENIERINFPNGGWRDVEYSDCDDGYCYVEDEDGTEWELQY